MSASNALPKQAKQMPLDDVRDRLTSLSLPFAADALADHVTASVKDERGAVEFLDLLLRSEQTQREERRIRTALRLSGLPTGQTISNFDFAFQPSVERGRIEALSTCSWIRSKQSLLILGPPGVGKTHLAVSLGVRAVECGFSVAYFRVEELLHAMRRDGDRLPAKLKQVKYMKPALLIVDEMGFESFTREESALFFRLVSYRYGRGSMCITSNKAISSWPEMLAGDEILTGAILDRLLHASTVLSIKGRSYRLRDLEEALRAKG